MGIRPGEKDTVAGETETGVERWDGEKEELGEEGDSRFCTLGSEFRNIIWSPFLLSFLIMTDYIKINSNGK